MGKIPMKKVLVTGSNGLVGHAIRRVGENYPGFEFEFATHEDVDLRNEQDVIDFAFTDIKCANIDYVIHCAAKVGGIGGNKNKHHTFFEENCRINFNVINYIAEALEVEKLICVSSVAIFPAGLTELREENIHDGPPHESEWGYAYSKRMMDIMLRGCREQYGKKNYVQVIPTNLYGPNDNFDIANSHVIPSLIHKLFLAKKHDMPFEIWGDGRSLREFLYVDDLAYVILELLRLDNLPPNLIVSYPETHSIADIAYALAEIAQFDNPILFDTDKPNGQRSRPSNTSLLDEYFPSLKYTPILEGLKTTYDWFANNYPNVRL
jgi:GDP-L-fucose synthase